MTAFEFGKAEAEDGSPFCPETVFVSDTQMGEYAQGFLSVQPDNQAALAFMDDLAVGKAIVQGCLAEMRAADLAVDEAQYTPRPGYDF